MGISVRFVRTDHSIMDGRYQGRVTNPEVFIESNEGFMDAVANLIAACNEEGDCLRIHSIVFDYIEGKWGVEPENSEIEYKDTESVIKTVHRILTRLLNSSDPKCGASKNFIREHHIDLSKLL